MPVHEVGEHEGRLYLSMKLIEGGSLAEHLAGQAAEPRACARLVATAARAVHHAHQRGILHRDLKPANILLDSNGEPHVTDFGLARRVEADASLTQTGAIVGTLGYMALEQASGHKGAVTTASDVYGLGAVLYAALTGRPPLRGETALDTLLLLREQEPEPPRKLNAKVDRDLETVCLKCLSKEPQRRYASAEALADDLERWLRGEPVAARSVGRLGRVWRWCRRHPARVGVLVVVLLFAGVAAGSIGWALGEQRARQRDAEDRLQEALEDAVPGLRQGDPHDPALVAAVQRAVAQRDTGVVRARWRARVEQLLRDVEMLRRLENARLQAAACSKEGFDVEGADFLYSQAFTWYGLDVASLRLQQAAEAIRTSAIRTHLVAALDDWTFVRNGFKQRARGALTALADLADDDLWRKRLRRAASSRDRGSLEELAKAKDVVQQPLANLVLLSRALLGARSTAVAERLTRRAQANHPGDFWINFELAVTLSRRRSKDWTQVVRFYQGTLTLRPRSAVVHNNLGYALDEQEKFAEAEAAYHRAIELHPAYAWAYINLGVCLAKQRKLAKAELALRKATEINPGHHAAYINLGAVLVDRGNLPEAEVVCSKAIKLAPDVAQAHHSMGRLLAARGNLEAARVAYLKATRLAPEDAAPHYSLGQVLQSQGKWPEAEVAFRKVIALKPGAGNAHNELGNVLQRRKKLVEAEAVYRQAIDRKVDDADTHYSLGIALEGQNKPAEAETAYRKAIELNLDHAEAHCNLGIALQRQGRFVEALAALKRGHELGSHRGGGWRYPSGQWVRNAERLAALDVRLAKVLGGEARPASADEFILLAKLCQMKKLYATEARFLTDAFAAQPKLIDDLNEKLRFHAARGAALAGCGQGIDAAYLPETERCRLRNQALEWLRDDLNAWRGVLAKWPVQARPVVSSVMQHWRQDDLAVVRDKGRLARLPARERLAWAKLWTDVSDLLARAQEPPPTDKETPDKQ